MQLDYSPRRSGKTTKMLNWAAEDPANRVVVCSSVAWRTTLYSQAKRQWPEVAWKEENFVCYASYLSGRGNRRQVWIDQADMLLNSIFPGCDVVGAGWTLYEDPLYESPVTPAPEKTQREKDIAQVGKLLANGLGEHAGRLLIEYIEGGGKL